MSRILRRKAAKDDLKAIWKYIASDNLERADAFLLALNEKIETIARNPLIGRERQDIIAGIRSFSFRNYVIFYFPLDNGIELVRVLHGARDIEIIFDEE